MELEWIAIALGDVAWISLAFFLGLFASQVGLPPLVGFLAAGFALHFLGFTGGEVLDKLADLGITLLLFTVGLKLNLRMLLRPQVWAVTSLHLGAVTAVIGIFLFWLALLGLPLFANLDFAAALTLAFALSFSSTVFAVSSLEKAGEINAMHGNLAVGILVLQDLAAVVFLVISTGQLPSPWAASLVFLVFLRPVLVHLLQRVGHGELLTLYGLVLALGGAQLVELVDIKGDLGALALGVLVSGHAKSNELAKSMFGFKDLFLLGFFLSIGLTGHLSWPAVLAGLAIIPIMFAKSALFLALMTRFRLRSRTSLLATMKLTNFSEFGLIVTAIGVANGWFDNDWLVVVAVAIAVSFVVSAPLVANDDQIYARFRNFWIRLQRPERLPNDDYLDTGNATIAVFGMGRVGTGAYDKMRALHGDTVIGIDFDSNKVRFHQAHGRNVVHGDPSDPDFWEKVNSHHRFNLVMLALPNLAAKLDALEQLHSIDFKGRISAAAKYPEEEDTLRQNGATSVFNIYREAGTGFADHTEATGTQTKAD